VSVRVCERESMCVCGGGESERESERERVCVCVRERERARQMSRVTRVYETYLHISHKNESRHRGQGQ